jgi:hypothetical protein
MLLLDDSRELPVALELLDEPGDPLAPVPDVPPDVCACAANTEQAAQNAIILSK